MTDPTLCDYWLKKIDRATWDRARAKARAMDPPRSMKWVIMHLIGRWLAEIPSTPAEGENQFFRALETAKDKPKRQIKVPKKRVSGEWPPLSENAKAQRDDFGF